MSIDTQGFSIPGSTLSKGAKEAEETAVVERKLSKQDGKIQRLNGVAGVGNKLWTYEFFGGMAGGWLAKQALKFNRTKLAMVLHAITVAPFETLSKTPLKEFLKIPSNYLNALHEHANEIGGGAKADWATGLGNKAASLETSANALAKDVAEKAAPVVGPLKTNIKDAVGSFAQTPVGSVVERGAQRAGNWQAERLLRKGEAAEKKLWHSFTHKSVPWYKQPFDWIAGKKPVEIEMPAEFGEIVTHAQTAKNAAAHQLSNVVVTAEGMSEAVGISSGEVRKDAFKAAHDAAIKLSKTASDDLKPHLEDVTKYLEKMGSITTKSHALGGIEEKGLVDIGKSMVKSLGKMTTFQGIMIGSGVFGLLAIRAMHKKTSLEAKAAHDGMLTRAGGDKTNPLMQAVTKAYKEQRHGHALKSGLEAIGKVGETAMFATPGGGGGAIIAATMLPSMLSSLVPDNYILNASTALQKREQGKIELAPEQQVGFIKQMVAAVANETRPKGQPKYTEYNNLVSFIAKDMVDRKLKVSEIEQVLGSREKFMALASQKWTEMKAAEAKPATEKTPAEIANDNRSNMQVVHRSAAETAYEAAEKPVAKIASISRTGTVVDAHKALSA